MLMSRESSVFLLIDVQEKLMPHILNADKITDKCQWLLRLSHELKVPQIVSEQYPSGLGKTIEPLKLLVKDYSPSEKTTFSCYKDLSFVSRWQNMGRTQVIIAGIETHVCVMQTAIDMKLAGFDVFVVVDAVSCRRDIDQKYGLKRMKQAGVQLVTTEMVFFEWLGQAGSPEFKVLSKTFL